MDYNTLDRQLGQEVKGKNTYQFQYSLSPYFLPYFPHMHEEQERRRTDVAAKTGSEVCR
jgi:hypothetical protein